MNVVNLGELITIQGGGTPDRQNPDYWCGNIPWASVKDLKNVRLESTQEFITKKGVENSATNVIPAGTVIVATRMAVGRACINIMPVAINQDLKALFCSPKLLPKYLLWFLTWASNKLENQATGATVKGITINALNELKIPFPPLEEQRRIAAILDKASAIRSKRFEAIRLTEELLRAVFLDMFGDPVTNPKGWEIKKLEDITTKITDGVHLRPQYTQTGIPFISVKDITTGKLRFEDCKFISEEEHQKYTKRCKPEFGDILYTKVGATYGRPALVNVYDEFSLYVSVCLIKPIRNLVRPEFLREIMATPAVKQQADKSIKGIGVPDLHLNMIKKFVLPVPELKIQDEFLKKTEKIQKLQLASEMYFIQAENLFNSLLHRAFRGEL
jgi:type I restriction enzyme, S subunit